MTNDSTFKRILVPMDASQFSRRALTYAIKVAKAFSSKIFVVTVVDISDFPPGMLLGLLEKDKRLEKSVAKFVSYAKTQVRKELLADVSICKSQNVDSDYEIIAGKPVEMILKFARAKKIDLIIMGSQGLRGIHKIQVLGSVSRKISELATCPVMIVR